MLNLDSRTLPLEGSHLIEASAGTGKTYNIVRIYLRLLLEKELTVDRILVMTFTVAATAEIRSRLNEFLRQTLDQWDDQDAEPIVTTLKTRVDSAKAKLLLQQAILHLDEAAIYTIHGFCKRALGQQAFFSGMSFNAGMDADSTLLKLQATQDWYRSIQQTDVYPIIYDRWPTPEVFLEYWGSVIDSEAELSRPTMNDLSDLRAEFCAQWPTEREQFLKKNKPSARSAQDTLDLWQSTLEKLDAIADGQSPDAFTEAELDKSLSAAGKQKVMPVSYRLVLQSVHNIKAKNLAFALDGVSDIRHRLHTDKGRLDQLDFNDLITHLRDAIQGENGTALQQAMLEQFPAALVDEFQDTDPDQYQILSTLYHQRPDTFLCMIGDPKQAIYGFRGGDVFAYLKAGQQVDHRWTMDTNYRSSPSVIEGYNQLFLQNQGHENPDAFGFGIAYRKVQAPADKTDAVFSDTRSAVQWVEVTSETQTPNKYSKDFQQTLAQWTSNEIVTLLNQVSCNSKPVQPGDIAILVRNYGEAEMMQNRLRQAGLASVYLSARQNIFHTEEALDAYRLLRGIWQLENDRLFVAALACSWIGLSDDELDGLQQDEHRWSHWQNQFQQWRENWQQRGLMSILLDILQNHHRPNTDTLERSLTNRLHLAERLQMESSHYRLPDGLLHWFAQALQEDSAVDENQLRLESDDALIKIITMHGAKGLEYPIVFLPFASYHHKSNRGRAMYRYHDRDNFDVQLAFLANDEQKALTEEEEFAEFIRLFYVATTRAEHRLYCCLAPFSGFATSMIGQTLKLPKYDLEAIEKLVCSPGHASILKINGDDIPMLSHTSDTTIAAIQPANFQGHIERDWWLSSFSALTRHVGHSGHSLPDRDEQEAIRSNPENLPLRFRLAKGAEAGNLLHDTLEHCDFVSPDTLAAYEQAKTRYSSLTETFSHDEFSQWLLELLNADLDGVRLNQLATKHTLREAEFYFPMHGQSVNALATLIEQKRKERFALPDRYKLKGMMHGFIDLIFEHNGRFFVADYKSTHLGHQISDYTRDNLRTNIHQNHYDLQYALYSLALHRYLKTRLPDYTPETHFGGVYYLYLRGMNPNSSHGIFYDTFSAEELTALDAVFSQSPTGAKQHV